MKKHFFPYGLWCIFIILNLQEARGEASQVEPSPSPSLQSEKRSIRVAIIDTGIDPHHPFLAHNLYLPEKEISPQNFGVDFTTKNGPVFTPYDQQGHGTHIAGIIKGIYSSVQILVIKYYNPKATGEENLNASIQALEYALKANVDIINYSGGGVDPSEKELKILRQAYHQGTLVVAAAGNEKSNLDLPANSYYPASYGLDHVISVTAHDSDFQILPVANWGKTAIDLAAPGFQISSTLPQGRKGQMTGTSQATAFVTGVAALIKSQYPQLSPQELKIILTSSAKANTYLKDKCRTGGSLDLPKALQLAYSYNLYLNKRKSRSVANVD